jgi:hypothetical protein
LCRCWPRQLRPRPLKKLSSLTSIVVSQLRLPSSRPTTQGYVHVECFLFWRYTNHCCPRSPRSCGMPTPNSTPSSTRPARMVSKTQPRTDRQPRCSGGKCCILFANESLKVNIDYLNHRNNYHPSSKSLPTISLCELVLTLPAQL